MPRRWGTLPAALQRVAEEHPHPASAPRLVIVVPTLNEADNLPRLVERFFTLAPAEADLLVVDDTSPDGTADSRLLVLAAPIAAQVFSLHQHASFTSGFPFGLLLGNLLLTVALVTITWNHGRHGGFAVGCVAGVGASLSFAAATDLRGAGHGALPPPIHPASARA